MTTPVEDLTSTAESLTIEALPSAQPVPHHDFQHAPYLVYYSDEFNDPQEASCYLKGCKW